MSRHTGSATSAEERERTSDEAVARDEVRSPTDLTRRSWFYVVRKTYREFGDDQCTDLAAGLTYYAVLSLFPAAIALISLLGVVGQGKQSVDNVMQVLDPLVSSSTLSSVRPALDHVAASPGAGLGLVIGLLGALWSASGYVGAFGRAMNRIYEIDEGRPFWKLRPIMLVITLVAILLVACVLVMLIVSGPLADSIGSVAGLGSQAVTAWNIVKWPVIVLVLLTIIGVLYYVAPNVKHRSFPWITPGGVLAMVLWGLASAGLAFYASKFGSYQKTYGTLAGVILFLVWMWVSNIALLLGAELNSELERERELRAGLPAEEGLQLPPRTAASSP